MYHRPDENPFVQNGQAMQAEIQAYERARRGSSVVWYQAHRALVAALEACEQPIAIFEGVRYSLDSKGDVVRAVLQSKVQR